MLPGIHIPDRCWGLYAGVLIITGIHIHIVQTTEQNPPSMHYSPHKSSSGYEAKAKWLKSLQIEQKRNGVG